MPRVSKDTRALYRSIQDKVREAAAAAPAKVLGMTRGRICLQDISRALRSYTQLKSISAMLHYRRDDKDLHAIIIREMLPAGRYHQNDYSLDVVNSGKRIHKAVGILCKKNGDRLWTRLSQLKTALKKGNIDAAIKKANQAAAEASMCASTVVEFCVPITPKRKRELIAFSRKK